MSPPQPPVPPRPPAPFPLSAFRPGRYEYQIASGPVQELTVTEESRPEVQAVLLGLQQRADDNWWLRYAGEG